METYLGRFSGPIWALTRMVFGVLFACHGAQKLFGVLGGQVATQPLFQAAGIIEFGGGLLVAIGFFASFAAVIASGEMAVAYFMMHAPNGFWPVQNKGEESALYCFFFLYVAARGSGIWSVDALRKKA